MPSCPSVVASTLRLPTSRARTSDSLDVRLRPGVVALELESARPVDARRERCGAHPRRLGQGDGARRRRGGAGVVADEERERGARPRGAGAKGVVAELLGSLLERSDVFGLLAAPAGVAVDGAARLEQGEAGRRIVGGNEREGAAEVVERGRVDVAARRVLAGRRR